MKKKKNPDQLPVSGLRGLGKPEEALHAASARTEGFLPHAIAIDSAQKSLENTMLRRTAAMRNRNAAAQVACAFAGK